MASPEIKTPISKKSLEAQADQLMKVSTNLFTAFMLTFIVVPMSAIMNQWLQPGDSISLLDFFNKVLSSWHLYAFVALEIALYKTIFTFRDRAFGFYDELYPDRKPINKSKMI